GAADLCRARLYRALPVRACGVACSRIGRSRDASARVGRESGAVSAIEGSGKRFGDVRVGDTFASALTVTETHIVLGAGLIGDFNPHHTNAEYAKRARFGTPILHGMLTSSIMGAAVGMYFHGTAIAYLEHNARFLAPVRAGDTMTTTWSGVEPL